MIDIPAWLHLQNNVHFIQSGEGGAGEMAWQDDARGHSDVLGWDDDSEPAKRAASAPVAYTPSEILPRRCAGERCSSRWHGRRHTLLVWQLP